MTAGDAIGVGMPEGVETGAQALKRKISVKKREKLDLFISPTLRV